MATKPFSAVSASAWKKYRRFGFIRSVIQSNMEFCYTLLVPALLVLSLLYRYVTSVNRYWKRTGVPCPPGSVPVFGHVYPMFLLQKNMIEMYRYLYNKMPDCSMIGFYNVREPALFVREPELIKAVLTKNFNNFSENSFLLNEDLDPLVAVNPFFINGERWKTSRQQLSSAFSSGKMKYSYGAVDEVCSQMKEYIFNLQQKDGTVELELKELFSRFTSGVIASLAFGIDGDGFKSDKDLSFRKMGELMFKPSFLKRVVQLITFLFPFLAKILRTRFVPVQMDRFVRQVVRDVMRHREENGIVRPDFMQLMIQYQKESKIQQVPNKEFNVDVIASHVTSFFIDGYETSSITMSFFAYQLAAHPRIQERVREEINAMVDKHGGLTYEAIQDMKYMNQTLNESMRLFPAIGMMLKICTEEIELVGSDGVTCKMIPGMPVAISIMGIHRDPKYWESPDEYDPDRFSPENARNHVKFTFIPFGEGPRICLGMRMAVMQVKAAIATIVSTFSLEVSSRTKTPLQLDPNHFFASAVGGLWVKLKRL